VRAEVEPMGRSEALQLATTTRRSLEPPPRPLSECRRAGRPTHHFGPRSVLTTGRAWGGEPTHGRVVGRDALCLPVVRSRACVDAWAGAASCVSFRDVALVAVWGLWFMLHREQVD
jgi:hypothetical protein